MTDTPSASQRAGSRWRIRARIFPTAGDACDNPPWQATEAQNLSDALKGVEWTNWWKGAMTPFQCTLSDGLRATRHAKPTADLLWSIMSQAYGCYGSLSPGKRRRSRDCSAPRTGQPLPPVRPELLPHRHQGEGHIQGLRGFLPDDIWLR